MLQYRNLEGKNISTVILRHQVAKYYKIQTTEGIFTTFRRLLGFMKDPDLFIGSYIRKYMKFAGAYFSLTSFI